jgi:lactoylglutathione lyase
MHTSLRLLVLRSKPIERLRDFFRALGVSLAAERHGNGPLHYAGDLGGVVLELYPLDPDAPSDHHPLRLGFTVDDLAATLHTLETLDAAIISEPRKSEWGVRAVVRDPDGRAVELYQR